MTKTQARKLVKEVNEKLGSLENTKKAMILKSELSTLQEMIEIKQSHLDELRETRRIKFIEYLDLTNDKGY